MLPFDLFNHHNTALRYFLHIKKRTAVRNRRAPWCSERSNIRTQARFFKLGEIDCFSAVFVIECERNPVVIKENRINKAVNQPATVVKSLGIKLSENILHRLRLSFSSPAFLLECITQVFLVVIWILGC